MKPPTVVEVDVLADRADGLVRIDPRTIRERFGLERAEEALDRRVVPAIAGSAHADADTMAREQCPVLGARVLRPAIGVMQESGTAREPWQRALEGRGHELRRRRTAHGPSHDPARGEIE